MRGVGGSDGNSPAEVYARIRLVPPMMVRYFGMGERNGQSSGLQRSLAYSLGRLGSEQGASTRQAQQGQKILEEVRRLGFV